MSLNGENIAFVPPLDESLFSGLQVVLKSILKALAPLMQIGLLVMFVFFTGWGMWEITHLPPATLP